MASFGSKGSGSLLTLSSSGSSLATLPMEIVSKSFNIIKRYRTVDFFFLQKPYNLKKKNTNKSHHQKIFICTIYSILYFSRTGMQPIFRPPPIEKTYKTHPSIIYFTWIASSLATITICYTSPLPFQNKKGCEWKKTYHKYLPAEETEDEMDGVLLRSDWNVDNNLVLRSL